MTTAVRPHASYQVPSSPQNTSRRPFIVVIGMHRSGTSLCSHVLTMLGIEMAEEVGENPTNPYGHFERWDIVGLHDELLGLFGRDYASPMHDFPLPPAWWSDLRVRPIVDRLKVALERVLARQGLAGFKDPRTALLLPLWNQIFVEFGLAPRYVVCLRDPAHVAASLHKRDGLERQTGELRALNYIVEALRYTQGRDRCFISYDDWFPDPMPNALKLLDFTQPVEPPDRADLEAAVHRIVHPELNRSPQTLAGPRQPIIRHFYNLVSQYADAGATDADLDAQLRKFSQHYVAFRQLLDPYEFKLKAVLAQHSALEAERAALISGREGDAQRHDAERQAAGAASATKDAQIHDLSTALQGSDAERAAVIAARDADVHRLDGELQAAAAAAATKDAQIRDLLAALQRSDAEHAALIAVRDADAQRLDAELQAAGTAVATRDAQIHELSAALARSEAERVALIAARHATARQLDPERQASEAVADTVDNRPD